MTTHYLLILLFFLIPNLSRGDSPLVFQFRETVHWDTLGPSVSAGNGLYVAYNGSHTHVMDVNSLQNGTDVQQNGYTAWRLIETNIDAILIFGWHGCVKTKQSITNHPTTITPVIITLLPIVNEIRRL